jgi:two-component system NtrC family sensor kinase
MEEKSKAFLALYQDNKMKRSDLDDYLKTICETTGMVQSNLHRASELIKSFKQVAVDRSNETKRKFEIKEYIQEVLISIQPKLKKTEHQVSVIGTEGIMIVSNPGAISQIVINLIENSFIHAFDKAEEGTGLGMHIVYNLVTQSLGGTIRCESKMGVGTSFILQIRMSEG